MWSLLGREERLEPLIARSHRFAMVARIVGVIAGLVAVVGAAASPLIRVVDLPQYGESPRAVELCFADLSSDRPACPYIKPARAGAHLPTVERDAAQLAAAGLAGGDDLLLTVAEQLVDSQRNGSWLYSDRVRLADSTLEPPWVNASAQGLGLSVLARAWSLTGESRYRDVLVDAVAAMPTSDDGWPQTFPDGSSVLAGGLNAVLGMWDAWRVTGDPVIRERFERAVSWLDENVRRYDRDFVVLYALGPHDRPANADLLQYTIGQLEIVGTISGRSGLVHMSREWRWRAANPGAFRLNLFVHALIRQPATWIAIVAGASLLVRRTVRQR